jgi:hypothetical protein
MKIPLEKAKKRKIKEEKKEENENRSHCVLMCRRLLWEQFYFHNPSPTSVFVLMTGFI